MKFSTKKLIVHPWQKDAASDARPVPRATRKASCYAGFTLVELLIVIAIIGILISISLVALGQIRKKGFDARIISDIDQLRKSAESLYASNGNYGQVKTSGGSSEIATISADITALGSSLIIKPFVSPPTTAYCAYAKLTASETDSWYCVDGPGVTIREITAPDNPASTCNDTSFVCP